MKWIALSLSAVAVMASAAPTNAEASGRWVLNPAKCPDLVEDRLDRREDRRDRRIDNGPLDRLEDRLDARENRRDERVVNCPARAFSYKGRGRPSYALNNKTAIVVSDGKYYHRRNNRLVVLRTR